MFSHGVRIGIDHDEAKAGLIAGRIPCDERDVSAIIAAAPNVLPIAVGQVECDIRIKGKTTARIRRAHANLLTVRKDGLQFDDLSCVQRKVFTTPVRHEANDVSVIEIVPRDRGLNKERVVCRRLNRSKTSPKRFAFSAKQFSK